MKICVEDFYRWIDDIPEVTFKDKCMIAHLVHTYASKYSVEEQEKEKNFAEWEMWLDSPVQYSKNDISKGLPTATYNAILRAGHYIDNKFVQRIKTNRDLDRISDTELERIRNMSKNKVALVREYLETNKTRILKGE